MSDGTEQNFTIFAYTVTVNRAPNITLINLSPSIAYTNDNLNCSFIATDDRLSAISVNISWYKNITINISYNISVTNNTQTSSTLGNANTTKNEVWNCTILPYDGNSYGNLTSYSVIIQNSPPTAPNISITPSSPNTNNDLNVVFNQVSQDNDSDSITYTYKWYKDGALQPGQTTSTVSSGVTSKNELWVVNVTPNDGTANGESATANVTIQNSLPSITSASISPTTAYETTTLTATASGWADIDGESENYVYQWFNQNGVIVGASSSTLTGANFNKSNIIYANITPYDSDAYGTSKLTNNVTIQNSLPTLTASLVTELGINGSDEDLIGSFSYSDADSDSMQNNETKWYKNDIGQNLANLTTISHTNTSAGDIWIFSARAFDGSEWGIWYNSSGLTILDISQTLPVLSSPVNNSYINTSFAILTYITPNYANMNCSIFAGTNINLLSQIKNNTNLAGRTTIIYKWNNLADANYYWKASCNYNSTLYNSTIKSFAIDTTYPITAPNLTNASDSDNDGNIEVNWTSDSDALSYNIYRSPTKITDAISLQRIGSTTLTSFEDNLTLHNNLYWYAITTVDAAGNENKSAVSQSYNATANDAIIPKTTENANATSLNGVTTLYWQKVTSDINGNSDELGIQYKIWHKEGSAVNLSKSLVNETADYIKTVGNESCLDNSCSTTNLLSGSVLYHYFITTIDDGNNENLSLTTNFANVTLTSSPPSGSSGGGGGGGSGGGGGVSSGGGGGTVKPKTDSEECSESWSCSEWYSCINDYQARSCIDLNNCGTQKKTPEDKRKCESCVEDWKCGEWTDCINNKQARSCIDKNNCGTSKEKQDEEMECALDTCKDNLKNNGEVGIDCGGPCRPCKASDFITGGAIALRQAGNTNPVLPLMTILFIIIFIVLRTIKKGNINFRKIASFLYIPLVVAIIIFFGLSLFSSNKMNMTGFFSANNNENIDLKDINKGSENPIKSKIILVTAYSIGIIVFALIIAKKAIGRKKKGKYITKSMGDKNRDSIKDKKSEIKHIEIEKKDNIKKVEIDISKGNIKKEEMLKKLKEAYNVDEIIA